MPNQPVQNRAEVATMIEKLFPYKQEEDLKIYAMLSVHNSIAHMISDNTARLWLVGAYTLDEALRENDGYLRSALPTAYFNWRPAVMINTLPFQHIVPPMKVAEMVQKIKADQTPDKQELITREAAQLEAYCRYVFEKANATPYEKGILTSILDRFIQNIHTTKPSC